MSVLGGRISVNNNASLSNVNGKIVLAAAANMRPQQLGDAKAAEIKQEEKVMCIQGFLVLVGFGCSDLFVDILPV